MNRREALSAVTVLLGGTVIGSHAFLQGCSSPTSEVQHNGLLSPEQEDILNIIGEGIIPATTSSPGARETNVGLFMNAIVTDCYSAEEQQLFLTGIEQLRNAGVERMDSAELDTYITSLEGEVTAQAKENKPHFYTMMRQLTVWGYLSSEPGATMALRHVAVPGRYDACIPLEPGQKAWG